MPISDLMNQGDLVRRVAALERRLQEIQGGRRLEDASIGARGLRLLNGGSLTISGGALRMNSIDGSIGLVYFGDAAGGTGARTWLFSFPSGKIAFGLISASGQGIWGGRDNTGNLILANDATSGTGLGRPYLNIPIYPSRNSQQHTGGPLWPATDSANYVELMHGFTTIWHPRLAFSMGTAATAGTTQWRLLLSGTEIASGSGNVSAEYDIPGWGDTTNPDDEHVIQVQVRNTDGGISWAQVDRCYGLQT